MTGRERFNRVLNYESVERVPNYEHGVWPQTKARWVSEGMPEDAIGFVLWEPGAEIFNLEPQTVVPVHSRMLPEFTEEVLEEDDRCIISRRPDGIVTKALKEGFLVDCRMSMDQYLRFPVETREDFLEIKKRFDPATPGRYPDNWSEMVSKWNESSFPVCLQQNGSFGFYGFLREWMGTVNLSLAFYDNPALIEEMLEYLEWFIITLLKRAAEEVTFDWFNFFEDLAFKTGPLISPPLFKKFIFPHYKNVIEFLKSNGVKFIWVDTDGNPGELIPMFLEAGVDCLWPCEIAAGMDPLALRKQYGKQLRLCGGVDKRIVAKGGDAVKKELLRLAPVIEEGGYFPTIDHSIPPDISYQNFVEYINLKRKILEGINIEEK